MVNFKFFVVFSLICLTFYLWLSMVSSSKAAFQVQARKQTPRLHQRKILTRCPLKGTSVCSFKLSDDTGIATDPRDQELVSVVQRTAKGPLPPRFCCSTVAIPIAALPNQLCFCHFDPVDDRFISGAMLHHNSVWEQELVKLCADLLDTLPIDAIVLDVGSNLGSVGLSLLASGRSVVMFEANPETSSLLGASLHLAGSEGQASQVKLFTNIVGDKAGEQVKLMRLKTNLGGTTVVRDAVWAAPESSLDTTTVNTTTIDTALGLGMGGRPDDSADAKRIFDESPFVGLMKIDVEGHETCVLAGAKELLNHRVKAPRFIVVEFWKRLNGCLDSEELMRWMVVDLNYHVLLFDNIPFTIIPDIVRGKAQAKAHGALHEPDDWQSAFFFASNETTSNVLFYK